MTVAQVAVTALGGAAIAWVLWYFLGPRGRGPAPPQTSERDLNRPDVEPPSERPAASSPHTHHT